MGDNEMKSGLACIDVESENPVELFKIWYKEAKKSDLVCPDALCFATSTRSGEVTARHLLLRRLERDGFVIMTDKRSKKCRQLDENPNASMAFLWCYKKDDIKVTRQVRIEGSIHELPKSEYQDLYTKEPVYAKVRAHICHQGQPVDWEALKRNHDYLYNAVINNKTDLSMPDHFVAYKLKPKMIEFYHSFEFEIADRVMFLLQENDNSGETATLDVNWSWKRISA